MGGTLGRLRAAAVGPLPPRAGAASEPRVVFTGTFWRDYAGDQSYDIAPDARFLLMKSRGGERVDWTGSRNDRHRRSPALRPFGAASHRCRTVTVERLRASLADRLAAVH